MLYMKARTEDRPVRLTGLLSRNLDAHLTHKFWIQCLKVITAKKLQHQEYKY